MPIWLLYVAPAVIVAAALAALGRRELRRADERQRMAATVLRLEMQEQKEARHRADGAGAALKT